MKRTKEFWTQIEKDRSDGMSLPDVCVKYDITRGIIKRARTDGKLNDVRDRPAKRNWDIIQKSIDDIGVDATLVMYNITIISLYSAKRRGKVSWKPRKPKYRGKSEELSVFNCIDWNKIQQYYDDNHSTRDISKELKISFVYISRAVKEGLLKLRNHAAKQKLSLEKRTKTLGGSLKWTDKQKAFHSDCMKRVVLNNPESYSANNICGRVKLYEVIDGFDNPTKVLGTWELLIANLLNDKKIKWTNKIDGFPYHWEDDIHLYFPDFHLPDLKKYIEVKGYQRERDEAKWNNFPHTLCILKEREIKLLQETKDILALLSSL